MADMPKRALSRKLAILASLVVYLLVISLILAALLTEFWIETNALKRNNQVSELSFVRSGLFSGFRQLNYGLGPRRQYFSVLEEIHNQVSFVSKTNWVFIVFCASIGLLWSFIGLIMALLNTLIDDISTIVGPDGFYVWSSFAFFSYMISVILFSQQFTTTITKNVLLPDHIEEGFSSFGLARLGVSFWLFCAGTLLLFIPCILIFITSKREPTKDKIVEFDNTALMY